MLTVQQCMQHPSFCNTESWVLTTSDSWRRLNGWKILTLIIDPILHWSNIPCSYSRVFQIWSPLQCWRYHIGRLPKPRQDPQRERSSSCHFLCSLLYFLWQLMNEPILWQLMYDTLRGLRSQRCSNARVRVHACSVFNSSRLSHWELLFRS